MLSVALAACGSSTTTTTNTAASSSPAQAPGAHSPEISKFVGAVDSICTSTTTKLHSLPRFPYSNFDPTHPDRGALPKVGQFFAHSSLPVMEGALSRVEALTAPTATRQSAGSLKRDVGAYVSTLRAQVRAAEASRSSAFIATVNAFTPIHSRLVTDFQALGVPACNGLFSSG